MPGANDVGERGAIHTGVSGASCTATRRFAPLPGSGGFRRRAECYFDTRDSVVERPEWVHASIRKITDSYFRYYDVLYDVLRDEVGGSIYWAWAPGRLTKLQCDLSAMISPGMFREFMLPILAEMTERVSYSLYHLDGPGAICHQDALLSIPRLDMI